MAPSKRKRGEKSVGVAEKSSAKEKPSVEEKATVVEKFISNEAKERYKDDVSARNLIAERGFNLSKADPKKVELFIKKIKERNWEKFCGAPSKAVISLVREFYANLPERQGDKCFVRGKWIPFDGNRINALYEIPHQPFDFYDTLPKRKMSLTKIARDICGDDKKVEWTITKGIPRYFLACNLAKESNAWFRFLNARLMPCSHVHRISHERALLLLALVNWERIDVGKLMHRKILECLDVRGGSLWFPSLITDLCLAEGVEIDEMEQTLAPQKSLDEYLIFQPSKGRQPEEEEESNDKDDKGTSLKDIAEMMERMQARMTAIELSQRQLAIFQHESNQTQWKMFQLLLGQSRAKGKAPLPVFPPLPPFAKEPPVDLTNSDDQEEEEDE